MDTKTEILVEQIYRNRLNLVKSLDTLRDSIANLVKEKGGFIDVSNNDGQNDNIYSALYDYCGAGELTEVYIKGIKVVGNALYAYVAPISNNKIIYTKEDMLNDEDNWYLVDISSDLVYSYTLHYLSDIFAYYEYV